MPELAELVRDYRRLTPAERGQLQRLVNERATALRADFLRNLWGSLVSWWHRRAAIAQLRSLDDATLKDIGIHRSSIEAAVDGQSQTVVLPLRREPPKPPARRAYAEKPQFCLQRTG